MDIKNHIKNHKLESLSKRDQSLHRQSEVKALLTYTKFFLFFAYVVFIGGSGLTLNELMKFFIDENYEINGWLTAITLVVLGSICFAGLWASFKEDSCLLLVHGIIISIVFVLHVILLFYLKNACIDTTKKCYRNLATPPGNAPILIAISELAIAICAFFMALAIEAEKRHQNEANIFDVT